MDQEQMNQDWQEIRPHAVQIGNILKRSYPYRIYPVNRAVPRKHVEEITVQLQTVIAEVLQAWLEAGSERDVTMENETLYRAIYDELASWSDEEFVAE